MKKYPGIAFFDFDGTITNRDSFLDFVRFLVGTPRFLLGMATAIPYLFTYSLGRISHEELKNRVYSRFFKGRSRAELERAARVYSKRKLPRLLRPAALQKIHWHQQQGHRVVVVSASADLWLQPFADRYRLELIATRLEVRNGRLSGRMLGPNCKGPQKVIRIREKYNLDRYEKVYAYGDSRGDREMLQLAGYREFKPFRRTGRKPTSR
jgi:HAD superfamily hydrolase (TIGR01490 family)